MDTISGRLQAVRESIAVAAQQNGRCDSVTLVAVSKTVAPDRIQAAYDAGQRVFGENRVLEAVDKRTLLDPEMPQAHWHLLGHLQSNKSRPALKTFDLIHSVDSLRIASKLDQMAGSDDRRVSVLVEVNVAGEQSKYGFACEDLRKQFVELRALSHLELCGLMTVAPVAADPAEIRWVFRDLRRLRDELRDRFDLPAFLHLSMGMSNDYQEAVREGATIVRIGRAIFGDRPPLAQGNAT